MDYVDWVGRVFAAVDEARRAADDGSRRVPFLQFPKICDCLGIEAGNPGFEQTEPAEAVLQALGDLKELGLVKLVEHPWTYQMTDGGRKLVPNGLPALWSHIFRRSADLDGEQLLVLRRTVELGQDCGDGYVRVRDISLMELQADLGSEWAGTLGRSKAWHIRQDLQGLGLVRGGGGGGGERLRPTYSGVVRATRKETTELQALVRGLLPDWESTNVDFKRELNLRSDKEKAEFVRDVIALANTKSPGRRFLVIGFGPRSRAFETSVDSGIDQDRLEDILNAYAEPAPRVVYTVVPWDSGQVGLVEVVREPRNLPYRVKRNFAHLRAMDAYVRHGSHTEAPSSDELASLEAEGQLAREQAE